MNNEHSQSTIPLRIAVIGAGAAGISAAFILQRLHHVTLFEKNQYAGGHTNTIIIEQGPDEGTPVDTGFIVLNDRTYPTLHALFNQLNVSCRNSDMSFGFHCEVSGLQYSGRGFTGIFAQPQNMLRPSFWQMLMDVKRFNLRASCDLHNSNLSSISLGEYINQFNYSTPFIENYLLPMGSAIWSTPADEMLNFPAETFLRFFENHGLLTLHDRPQWQTVVGGSHAYIKAFLSDFNGTLELQSDIQKIQRDSESVTIHFKNKESQQFDRVVIAVHADQVLPLLAEPSKDEQTCFSCWRYTTNHTVLHTDKSVMPPNTRAWASWNYTREKTEHDTSTLSLTYHMNRLQGLKTRQNYFVTLNRKQQINPKHIIREIQYTHPFYTNESVATQETLKRIYGKLNTYYCGSYFGYGFHEDAVKSGLQVARAMGMDL